MAYDCHIMCADPLGVLAYRHLTTFACFSADPYGAWLIMNIADLLDAWLLGIL